MNGVATLNYGVLGPLLSAIINMVRCAAFILVCGVLHLLVQGSQQQ